jgi:hypothetical protein
VGGEGGWEGTGKRSVKEGEVSFTRCRVVRVFLSQLTSAGLPSTLSLSSSSSSLSPVRSITGTGTGTGTGSAPARIFSKGGRSSSSESEISPSSERSAVRADGSKGPRARRV